MYNYQAMTFLAADAIAIAWVVVQPLSRRFDDSDQGDGTLIKLAAFGRPSVLRVGVFLAISVAVSTVMVGLHPGIAQIYRDLLTWLLGTLIQDPAGAAAYARTLLPLVPAAFAGYLLTAAIVMPGTVGRRLMILLHGPLFIALSLLTDCALGVLATFAHITSWPTPLLSMYLQYLIGYLVVFRLFFTSHQLPKMTPVPRLRRGDWRDNLVVLLCLGGATGIALVVATVLYRAVGSNPALGFVILMASRATVVTMLSVLLLLVRRAVGKPPAIPLERPPLEVIIPAFNESVCIERLLWSIDRAAQRYGGPVRVIMCDDGSTDDTRTLAQAAISSFRHATGVVLDGAHGGKSKALNLALARCTSEFVYRLDADCAIDADAFVYSVAHFLADPRVGLVGARHVPKEPYTSWLHRMRALELVYSFGFSRIALAQIDAVPCIPGSFCAFRRQAALAVGGFPHGLYGEDVDFTCAIARLGYRAVVDGRVVSYEDVPITLSQLRVQRFRWGIGGRLVYSRFTPFNREVGAPGPRFWFQMTKGAGSYMLVPAHLFLWLLSLEYAIVEPSLHNNVLKWVGALLLGQVLAAAPKFVVFAYYRRLRVLAWLPLWIPFMLLKRFCLLDAMLAFRMRPVKPPLALRDRWPTSGRRLVRR